MSILDEIARGGRTSGLDIAKAGVQGQKDALALQGMSQDMQLQAMKIQMYKTSSEIKKKARGVYQSSDLSSVQGTRETSQKLFAAGDVEGGLALEKDADAQEYQNQKLALDKRKLSILEKSWKTREKIANIKAQGKGVPKFKTATTSQMKSTSALLMNDETFNGLEDEHKGIYTAQMTQAVSDYMIASKSAGNPQTRMQSLEAVSRFADAYIQQEGGGWNPMDANKFDAETFRTDFSKNLFGMVGLNVMVKETEDKLTGDVDKTLTETDALLTEILGK